MIPTTTLSLELSREHFGIDWRYYLFRAWRLLPSSPPVDRLVDAFRKACTHWKFDWIRIEDGRLLHGEELTELVFHRVTDVGPSDVTTHASAAAHAAPLSVLLYDHGPAECPTLVFACHHFFLDTVGFLIFLKDVERFLKGKGGQMHWPGPTPSLAWTRLLLDRALDGAPRSSYLRNGGVEAVAAQNRAYGFEPRRSVITVGPGAQNDNRVSRRFSNPGGVGPAAVEAICYAAIAAVTGRRSFHYLAYDGLRRPLFGQMRHVFGASNISAPLPMTLGDATAAISDLITRAERFRREETEPLLLDLAGRNLRGDGMAEHWDLPFVRINVRGPAHVHLDPLGDAAAWQGAYVCRNPLYLSCQVSPEAVNVQAFMGEGIDKTFCDEILDMVGRRLCL